MPEAQDWGDRVLLAVLGFLNQSWLSIAVSLGGAMLVAFLARISPKEDWKYLSDGPGKFLLGAWFLLAFLKLTPRVVYPHLSFVCDRTVTEPTLGIPVSQDCHAVSEGTIHTVYDYTWGQFGHDLLFAFLQDLVLGLIGGAVGFLLGFAVVRLRRTPAQR